MKTNTILLAGVKQKLLEFRKSGKVFLELQGDRNTTRQKLPDPFKASTLNRCVKILRNQYDGLLFDENSNVINTSKITTRDLTNSKLQGKNLLIFKNLMKLRSVDKKPIDKTLFLTLLGVKPKTLRDKVMVTKQIEKLLQQDNDTQRARYLLNLSFYKNPVSMNRVIEFTLKTREDQDKSQKLQNVQSGLKILNDCKKWGYKPNEQTYVILFGGIARSLEYGELDQELTDTLLNLYKSVEKPTLSMFNSLLSCLVKNLTDDQYEAWELFNSLEDFKPSAQTFTIFLQGIWNNYDIKTRNLTKSSQAPSLEKNKEFYRLGNELIHVAQSILSKVKREQLDEEFVVAYITSFSHTIKKPGHDYNSDALKQLCVWVPEFNDFVDKHSVKLDSSKALTETKAYEFKKLVNDLNAEQPTETSDLDKVTAVINKSRSNIHINKFLLMRFVDGLCELDRPVQFINSIWWILSDFGGIEFKTLPNIKSNEYQVEVNYDLGVDDKSEVVDTKLIRFFIFKINQIFLKEMKSSSITLHLVRYIQKNERLVDSSVYDGLLSVLNEEIEYFHRSIYNLKKEKKSLTKEHLEYLAKNLKLYTDICPIDQVNWKKVSRIIDKIVDSNWRNMRTSKDKLKYNQLMVDSFKNYSNIKDISVSLNPCVRLVQKLSRSPEDKKSFQRSY
ncbi:hypothetical protein PSN45_003529 [Yamadazyma tenuis]|uniref:uncharacterized protein n=1 Tax=Candida tenuis TaxID=2315449 RepID=UPI00279D2638|nr:hypothetical protein PSN45_003529 [Yamadazyma tenuis]